jgi:hypothetical protein
MIDVIENSNAPVCNYNLVSHEGNVIETAKLTKYEAYMKNYAFGLNHVKKRYELIFCDDSTDDSVKLILPS